MDSREQKIKKQKLCYQAQLRELKFDYDKKLEEIHNIFEFKLKELGEIEVKIESTRNENENLRMLNNNLLNFIKELEISRKNQEEQNEISKRNAIKEIEDLQNLIYGFEKSKNSLANDINKLVENKERSIIEVKRYKDEEKDYNVFIKQTKIEKDKLYKLMNGIEAEQGKLLALKESLRIEKREFEEVKKENDKKFTEWTKLKMQVQQYAKLLQNYYNEHNIKLSILDKFGIKG